MSGRRGDEDPRRRLALSPPPPSSSSTAAKDRFYLEMIPKDVLLLPASPERRASSSTGNGKVREDFREPFYCPSLYSSKAQTQKQSLGERGTQKCSLPAVFPLASYFFFSVPLTSFYSSGVGKKEVNALGAREGLPACAAVAREEREDNKVVCGRVVLFVEAPLPPRSFVCALSSLPPPPPYPTTAGGGGGRISRSPQRPPPPPPLLPPPPRPPPPPPPPRCYFCCCCCGVRSFSFASRRRRIRRRRRRVEGGRDL